MWTLTGNGLARRVHVALVVLLVVGVAGSLWMSLGPGRARRSGGRAGRGDRRQLAHARLPSRRPPARREPERVRELSRAIDDVVLDASDFEHVTLYSGSGECSRRRTATSGQRLAGNALGPSRVPRRPAGLDRRRHAVGAGRSPVPVRRRRRRGGRARGPPTTSRRPPGRGARTCSSSRGAGPRAPRGRRSFVARGRRRPRQERGSASR